jgi:hypothetical protein
MAGRCLAVAVPYNHDDFDGALCGKCVGSAHLDGC